MSGMFEQSVVVPLAQKLRYTATNNDVRNGNKDSNTESNKKKKKKDGTIKRKNNKQANMLTGRICMQ
jgi:hypothetical protein